MTTQTGVGSTRQRGPEELRDLPEVSGKKSRNSDLPRYGIRNFAEITDAPRLTTDSILRQATGYLRDGAAIIDVGSLPHTPFPHLEETVRTVKSEGVPVSADSLYRGVERARARTSWQLGKRYAQDENLNRGCAIAPEPATIDPHNYKPAGTNLRPTQRNPE